MNEALYAGEQCFRIIREFETAPPDCRQTAEGAALDAYICPSGQPTLWFGCCYWDDGRLVEMGDTIEPGPQAERVLRYNIRYCEEYVREWVKVPLTQYQFDALCSFRFNTRPTTLSNSSRLLPAVNAQEWQKAAVAFTEFVYGSTVYNGKPYQRALRGLLRRRLWEGLIFLGYDPEEAVKDGDVALPCDRKLLSSGVYRDIIRSEGVTTLNQVRMKALPLTKPADAYPPIPVPTVGLDVEIDAAPIQSPAAAIPKAAQFEEDELILSKPAPPIATEAGAGPAPLPQPEARGPVPHVNETPISSREEVVVSKNPPSVGGKLEIPKPSNSSQAPVSASVEKPAAAPASPPVAPPVVTSPPKPPPVIAPKQIDIRSIPYGEVDPANGAKNMTDSRRVLGMVVVGAGSLVQILAAREVVSSSVGAIFFDMSRDPIVVALFCGAVFWVVGWLTRKRGTQIVAKGMAEATTVLK